MKETILSKDTICVAIGDDHTFNCNAVSIGRAGENSVTQLEITIPEALSHFDAYLDFKKPRGEKVKTPKLTIENCVIEYDIPEWLLNETGNLEVQVVLQNDDGAIWKSGIKKYVIIGSIDAVDDIPHKEDFITQAQKILDQLGGGTTPFSNALKGSASGEIISIADVSPIDHIINVKLTSKNLLPYPFYATSLTTNGITYTDNGNGTVTVNGTATADADFFCANKIIALSKGTYTLSGCAEGGSSTTYQVGCMHINGLTDYGTGKTINISEETTTNLYIRIRKGVTVENLVFKPQLEQGSIATEFTFFVKDFSTAILSVSGEDIGTIKYTPNTDGIISGVKSIYPITTLSADTQGVIINCEYNRDINKAFAELQKAILNNV